VQHYSNKSQQVQCKSIINSRDLSIYSVN